MDKKLWCIFKSFFPKFIMGLRAYIRDIIVFILFFKLTKIYFSNKELTFSCYLLSLILLILTVWFLLERIGFLEKII